MTVPVNETPVTTLGWKVGLVSGRVLRAVADIGPGDDALPDVLPAKGDIVFTPKVLESVVPGSPSIRVRSETVTASLDADGYISRNFNRGIWLWAGTWTVNATSVGAGTFEIVITEKNDKNHPLDLWSYSAVPPAPGVTQYTLTLPAGGVAGQVLALGDDGRLMWVNASTGGGTGPQGPAGPKGETGPQGPEHTATQQEINYLISVVLTHFTDVAQNGA